ncbi:MAG: short chain dehydrogenase [Gemmatimonadales bacterium]
MRIVVIGATGTIGSAVVATLGSHVIIAAGRQRAQQRVDLSNPGSIREMYRAVGRVDAVVCTAGEAAFAPLSELTVDDFQLSLSSKLMGQVNLVRSGLDQLADGGSFTLTSGVLARLPSPGSAAVSLVNAGLEGFVRAAALEMPRRIRINIVSPGWVAETLKAMGRDPAEGTPAAVVARAYRESVEGSGNGSVIEPSGS